LTTGKRGGPPNFIAVQWEPGGGGTKSRVEGKYGGGSVVAYSVGGWSEGVCSVCGTGLKTLPVPSGRYYKRMGMNGW